MLRMLRYCESMCLKLSGQTLDKLYNL